MSENPLPAQQQPAAYKKYLDSSRHMIKRVREFDYKKFFQDIITFLSIVLAYFVVSLTYQFHEPFQKLIKINLKKSDTIPLLSFIFSLYLIFWNLVAHFLKKRALRPPPKKDEYEAPTIEEPKIPQELPPLPNGQLYAHDIINKSINQTVYLSLLLLSIAAYSYLNQPHIANLSKLVDCERINYIGVWFLAANQFYLFGSLFGKITKMGEWKVLGVAMGYILGFLSLGLANGYNTFIFI